MDINYIPIDKEFQLDSFKIRIPVEECEILNEGILGNLVLMNDKTGEIVGKPFKENAYPINDRGINIYFAIEKQITSEQVVREFVIVLITAKVLKERYFEGITKENVKKLYEELIDYKVVSFNYNSFLSGEVTDADFKRDIRTNDISKIVKTCYALTKDLNKELCKQFLRNNSKAIQWSKREETKYQLKPFIKIYQKGLELKHKRDSKEFFESFLFDSEEEIDSRVRMEFTVKNKKHFRKYGINSTALKSVLNLTRKTKMKMFQDSVSKHLDIYEIKPVRIKADLPANDKIVLKLFDIAIKTKQYTSQRLIELLLEDIPNRSQRAKKRKQLDTLYNQRLKLSNVQNEREAKLREEIKQLLFT